MTEPDAANPDHPALPGAKTALTLLLLINLFNYIDRSILFAVQGTIGDEFHVSKQLLGLLVLGFLVSYMLLAPAFGLLADRFSRWLLIGVGVAIWSLASGGSGLATTYLTLLATRCVIGVGEAAYGPVAPTLIADFYPVKVRGRVLAWFYAAIPVGSAIGYIAGGPFAHPGKWHHAFLLTVPPGLLLAAWCFFMRDPRAAGRAGGRPADAAKPFLADYKALARIPSFVLNTAAMTCMTFAIGGVQAWMPTYLTDERAMTPERANLWLGGIVVLAGVAATLAGGWAGDKLRDRFPGSYFLVSGAGMLAGFPLFLLLLYTPFPYAWGVLFAAVFCFFFNTGPSNTALANVTPPAVRATAFAANILVIHLLGDAISPFVIGAIADRTSLKVGFVAVSLMMLAGGVVWLFAAPHLRPDTDRVERGGGGTATPAH